MIDATHDEFPKPSAAGIARRLMETARQEPSLLGRSRPSASQTYWMAPVSAELPVSVTANTSLALYEQCEHLASVAVEAAQQAEDAYARARAAFIAARRGMIAFGLLGILGVAIGAAAMLSSNGRTTEAPASPVTVASANPPAPAAAVPDADVPALHTVYVPPLPTPPIPIERPTSPPMATYVNSVPWPTAEPVHYRRPLMYQRMPPFVATLHRDISMLLHVP